MWRINREAVLLGSRPGGAAAADRPPIGGARRGRAQRLRARPLEAAARHDQHDDGARLRRRAGGRAGGTRLNRVHGGIRGDGLPGDGSGAAAVGAGDVDRDQRRRLPALGWAAGAGGEGAVLAGGAAGRRPAWHRPRPEPGATGRRCRPTGSGCCRPTARSRCRDVARRLAPSIIRPPFPLVPGLAIDLLTLPGFALLPPRIREEFGIAWSTNRERTAIALGYAVRSWTRVIPLLLRSMPQAISADRRVQVRH